jgi:DNA-binding PadR family transcriptional regulator
MAETSLTDAEFVVLSLICEAPLHGYQIEQQIQASNMPTWADLSTSSIYYLLGKMEGKGWIEQINPERENTAGKPRKVYQATEEGVSLRKKATLRALQQPISTNSSFQMGLHNLRAISPSDALEAVRTYRDLLDKDLQQQLEDYQDRGESIFSRDILFEYRFVLGGAELAFLADLIPRLEDQNKES